MIKVNTDPDCPGAGCAPDDASLTNWTLNHDATRANPRMRYGFAHIPKKRWEEIFKPQKAVNRTNGSTSQP